MASFPGPRAEIVIFAPEDPDILRLAGIFPFPTGTRSEDFGAAADIKKNLADGVGKKRHLCCQVAFFALRTSGVGSREVGQKRTIADHVVFLIASVRAGTS